MRTGIVGFGNIGKKHQQALNSLSDFKLVAICDQNPSDEIDQNLYYGSIDGLLKNAQEIDLISICTPNHLHEAHCVKALNNGLHVICEKPFALTGPSCQNIIDASRSNGRQVFCVMQNRFSGVSQWLKDLIEHDILGNIYFVNVACYWNRSSSYYLGSEWRGQKDKDGGTLFTQFSHYVDTLFWLFGNLNVNNALFKNFNHVDTIDFEDSCTFNFNMNNGAIGSFSYTTSSYNKNFESTLTIIAQRGTIKISGQYMNEIEYCDIEGIDKHPFLPSDNIANLSKVYRNAKDVILNNAKPMTSAEDGLAVVSIIESVYDYK